MSIWTTDATNWGERNIAGVESVFFHHPNASLCIYSNHLPPSAIEPLAARGLDVRVLPYSLDALLSETPAAPWLGELARWECGPYFYTHVTDVIRLALLFRDGGVYVDTDVILIRPFRIQPTPPEPPAAAGRAAGREGVERVERLAPRGVVARGPPLPLTPHALGAEAHTINDTPILNGAIMVFARGSPFLWGAMKEFAKTYRDYEWGWNGPELLTRVRRRCPHNVTVLSEDAFYPFHWEEVELYSTDGHARENELMWEVVTTRSYAAHLWNKKSNALELASSSVYARLMREFRLPAPAAAAAVTTQADPAAAAKPAAAVVAEPTATAKL
jgi:lactosylceramide 4-alpha-galactosyltransferase